VGTFPVPYGQTNGKLNIAASFVTLLNASLPDPEQSFSELFAQFDEALRQINPEVKQGTLSRAHGDWYEWLIAIAAWNVHAANPGLAIALPLPNVTSFNVGRLYTPDLYAFIQDLRTKVQQTAQVELITSNPDFVILDVDGMTQAAEVAQPIQGVTGEVITMLKNQYSVFTDSCSFERITGYAGLKSSLRPDRRLQLPHEGSLMKALYRHMQTRLWILEPQGIRYYAITPTIGPKDQLALRTVATHSITTVLNTPERAVDEVFLVDSMAHATASWQAMLTLPD
jgi:hypothetical protein